MDGARLWNASIASKIAAKDIVSGFDSVTFCLSKGLGIYFLTISIISFKIVNFFLYIL